MTFLKGCGYAKTVDEMMDQKDPTEDQTKTDCLFRRKEASAAPDHMAAFARDVVAPMLVLTAVMPVVAAFLVKGWIETRKIQSTTSGSL